MYVRTFTITGGKKNPNKRKKNSIYVCVKVQGSNRRGGEGRGRGKWGWGVNRIRRERDARVYVIPCFIVSLSGYCGHYFHGRYGRWSSYRQVL